LTISANLCLGLNVCCSLQSTFNGINFYSQVLTIILLCNQHLHPPNLVQDNKTQLHHAVYQFIHEAHSDPLLQDLISSFIQKYYLHAQQSIFGNRSTIYRCNKKLQPFKAKLHTQDIRQFFPVLPRSAAPNGTAKNLLHPL